MHFVFDVYARASSANHITRRDVVKTFFFNSFPLIVWLIMFDQFTFDTELRMCGVILPRCQVKWEDKGMLEVTYNLLRICDKEFLFLFTKNISKSMTLFFLSQMKKHPADTGWCNWLQSDPTNRSRTWRGWPQVNSTQKRSAKRITTVSTWCQKVNLMSVLMVTITELGYHSYQFAIFRVAFI